jgi:hypothetical protein
MVRIAPRRQLRWFMDGMRVYHDGDSVSFRNAIVRVPPED